MFRYVVIVVLAPGLFDKAFGHVQYEETVYRDAMEFIDECGSRSISFCFKQKTLNYIERLPAELVLGGGILRAKSIYSLLRVNQNEGNRISKPSSSSYSADTTTPTARSVRENVIDEVLLERIADYLSAYTFEFQLSSDVIRDIEISAEEGRKKKDNGGGKVNRMMNMMMLFQVKTFALGAIAIKTVGLIAFKALIVAKVALIIASLIALKKFVEQKHITSTYGVVTHPNSDDYSDFDRSFNTQDLPYRRYANKNKT